MPANMLQRKPGQAGVAMKAITAIIATSALAAYLPSKAKEAGMSDTTMTGSRPETEQAASAFQKRFAPLYATVFREGGTFGGQAMSANLQALEPLLQAPGTPPRDIFLLYYTAASVYGRRSMPTEAAQAAQKALAALPQTAAGADLAYPHFFLRYSSIRWLADSEQYDAALKQVRAFQAQYPLTGIARLPQKMSFTEGSGQQQASNFPTQLQILGIYEDEGYVLHEQKQFRQALQANQKLLPIARERLQALDELPRLRGLLSNLAQNSYELGQLDQARTYLQERLQIAQNAGDHATVYDCHFQLMVLAHERQKPEQAQQWLDAYEQYAQAHSDSDQLARAKDLRAELAEREAASKPQRGHPSTAPL